MNQNFASFLRTLRRGRKLSQMELAKRAHISERALRYWEAGTTSPGQWELESVLMALELTAGERAQALSLLPTCRGMRLSREEANASLTTPEERGPFPDMGSLLQTMRLRRGLTQTQMAAALKITRFTILRWESAEYLPSAENLERVCTLLGAYPEERAALSNRQMQMWEGKPHLSLEECAEQVETLDSQGARLQTPLIDLYALTLKRQLWLLAGESQEALQLLVRVQVVHATWLMLHDRKEEAEVCIQRSLNTLRGRVAAALFWQAALNLAAQFAAEGQGGHGAGVQVLERWLPAFPKKMQATLWCDMALYAGRGNQHEAATTYLANARDVLPYSTNAQGMAEHYYPLTQARTLLSAKRPVEALEWLPPVSDAAHPATSRAFYQLLWAEAFLEAGEKDAAQRQLDQLNTLLAEYPQPRLKRKLHTLAARL